MWALLGTTKIAEQMVHAIREAGDDVISVYTNSNRGRLESFALRFNILYKTTNIDEALKVPGINAVWIGTPNQTHAHLCAKAFAIDTINIVLSEKSLARDMMDARNIEKALESTLVSRHERKILKPLIFREAIFYLNHPIINKFYEFLKTNALGNIKFINAEYSRDLSRVTNAESGGAIYNLGVYPVSLAHLALATIYGEDVFAQSEIQAIAHIQSDKKCPSEKNLNYVARSTAVIQFANDIKATITACELYESENSNQFEIVGSNGRVIFRTNPFSPAENFNQFDFIDWQNSTKSFIVKSELNAYTYQIMMTKHDLLMERQIAARPTATISDSMAIMEFLTKWESASVANPETRSDKTEALKLSLRTQN